MKPNIVRQFFNPKTQKWVGEDDRKQLWEGTINGLSGDVDWTKLFQTVQTGVTVASNLINKPAATSQATTQQPSSVPNYPDYAAQTAAVLAQVQAQQQAAQQAQQLSEAQAALKAAQEAKAAEKGDSGISNQMLLIGGLGLATVGFLLFNAQKPRYAAYEPKRSRR